MHRLAEWQYSQSPKDHSNLTSILLQLTLRVHYDLSTGGQQLSCAIHLRNLSATDGNDGNVESAMVLGYRHLYSVTGGSTLVLDLFADDGIISMGYVAEIFVCLMLRYYWWSCLVTGSRADDSGLSFTWQGKFFCTDVDSNNISVTE